MKAIKLDEGEHLNRSPNNPIIHLVEDGQRSYLWIGNDAVNDKACFATLSGAATLRRLAKGILSEVGEGEAQ